MTIRSILRLVSDTPNLTLRMSATPSGTSTLCCRRLYPKTVRQHGGGGKPCRRTDPMNGLEFHRQVREHGAPGLSTYTDYARTVRHNATAADPQGIKQVVHVHSHSDVPVDLVLRE